jgi:hypothetical protein
MLLCAGLLVPSRQRAAWLEEWRSELWYVYRSLAHSSSVYQQERTAIIFCLGAFQDAWSLRCERETTAARFVRPSQSAVRCTGVLFFLVVVSFVASLLLPNLRSEIHPSSYRDSRHLVLISPFGTSHSNLPNVQMRQLRLWQRHAQHMFSEFAFYEPIVKPVRIATHYTSELNIARASANLFPMLGVRPWSVATADSTLPMLLVSQAIWQQQFHSDSSYLGRTVEVGIYKAILAGVISKDQWRLPGTFDAWLLEPGDNASVIPDNARGFLVGHLIDSSKNMSLGQQWQMSARQTDEEFGIFECIALSEIDQAPFGIYVFTVLLALIALPATTSLPLGEYPSHSNKISWPLRLRRWMFLAVKFSLLLPTIYFSSVDFAHLFAFTTNTTQYIQIVTSFLIGLFGFRWALRDQRKRCPVCLCTLTNPARVGQPSRNFLAWSGTELICVDGHGLLHVPELPTSWFATQRWLYLDSSWSELFLGTG